MTVYIPPIAKVRDGWGTRFVVVVRRRNKDNSRSPPGMTTRKTRTKAKGNGNNNNSKSSPGTCESWVSVEEDVLRTGFYLGMRVKLWMETFAPPRARSLADRKTMVISLN